MPHQNWCGKPCADCADPCALDESIPCSPDCENLFGDGSRDITKCFHAGCDVSSYRMCASCDAYSDGDGYESQSKIWSCVKCNAEFCEDCFESDLGARNMNKMVSGDENKIFCPDCYRKSFRISKHFKANSVYQDKTGQQYTIFYKPHIRGYHMVRLQSNGDTICNSSFVFHKWIRAIKYIGLRKPVDYGEDEETDG